MATIMAKGRVSPGRAAVSVTIQRYVAVSQSLKCSDRIPALITEGLTLLMNLPTILRYGNTFRNCRLDWNDSLDMCHL